MFNKWNTVDYYYDPQSKYVPTTGGTPDTKSGTKFVKLISNKPVINMIYLFSIHIHGQSMAARYKRDRAMNKAGTYSTHT